MQKKAHMVGGGGVSFKYLIDRSPRIFIRMLPPVVWVALFLSAARSRQSATWSFLPSVFGSSSGASTSLVNVPTEDELAALVTQWGFRRKDWATNPITLVTHLFVHANVAHLTSNILAYLTVSLEYGSDNLHNRFTLEERLIGRSTLETVWTTISSSAILLIGGIVGGLAGHFLQVKRQEVQAVDQYGFGFGFVERLVGSVHRAASERVYICGASAGISAIGGFNAVFYGRYMSGLFTLIPALMAVISDDGPNQSLFFVNWSGEGYIGHAAHLGGFACGCLIGLVSKTVNRRRHNGAEQQQQQGGHRLGGRAVHHDPEVAAQRERWQREFRYE